MLTEEEMYEAMQAQARRNIQNDLVKAVSMIRAAQHYLDETEQLDSTYLDDIYDDLIQVKIKLERMVAEYENEH